MKGFSQTGQKVWAACGNLGIFFPMLLKIFGHSGEFLRNVFQDT
jgi:hypothetical protein